MVLLVVLSARLNIGAGNIVPLLCSDPSSRRFMLAGHNGAPQNIRLDTLKRKDEAVRH
jgi:hypothetical protein